MRPPNPFLPCAAAHYGPIKPSSMSLLSQRGRRIGGAFSEGLQHPRFLPPLFYRLFSISLQNPPPVYYSSRLKAQKSVTYTQNYGPLPSSEKRDSPKGEKKGGKRSGWHGSKSGTEKIEATNHSETSMILLCPGGIRGYPTAAATATH